MWQFSCTIYKFSFIQSFLCEEQRLAIYRSWLFRTRNVSTCTDTLCVQTRSRAQLRVNYPPLSLGHHATHLAKCLLSACVRNITYHPVSPNSQTLIFSQLLKNPQNDDFSVSTPLSEAIFRKISHQQCKCLGWKWVNK